MPPELAPHRGTWLSWPHRASSWPGLMDSIPPIFADIVAALALGEEVHINITGQGMKQQIRTLLDERDVSLEELCCSYQNRGIEIAQCSHSIARFSAQSAPVVASRATHLSTSSDGRKGDVGWSRQTASKLLPMASSFLSTC